VVLVDLLEAIPVVPVLTQGVLVEDLEVLVEVLVGLILLVEESEDLEFKILSEDTLGIQLQECQLLRSTFRLVWITSPMTERLASKLSCRRSEIFALGTTGERNTL
jgi:hypothetical protein